ncbi:hypothetical protein NKG94_17975 [Micromonospora sp. M12]
MVPEQPFRVIVGYAAPFGDDAEPGTFGRHRRRRRQQEPHDGVQGIKREAARHGQDAATDEQYQAAEVEVRVRTGDAAPAGGP